MGKHAKKKHHKNRFKLFTDHSVKDYDLTSSFSFCKTEVTKISTANNHHLGKQFKPLSRSFKEYAFQLFSRENKISIEKVRKIFKQFQVHHIKPKALGGSNDFSNFALVDPDIHLSIHKFIDPQVINLNVGQSKEIKIPKRSGIIWMPKTMTLDYI